VQEMPLARELPEGSLDVLARALEDECRHLHGRYMSLSPALGTTLAGIRGVVALLLRPAGRIRSLKMALTPRTRRTAPADQAATAGRQRH